MDAGIVSLPVDPGWAVGYLLALTRVAAFAIASPIIGRSVSAPARVAFAVAVAMAMTRPAVGVSELGELVGAGIANAAIGAILGYVTGLILHLFTSAGGIVDLISGLSVSMVFDPMQGEQGGVFGRMFHLVGTTMFLVGGGLTLLVGGLVASTRVLPVEAPFRPHIGLTGLVVDLVTTMIRSAVELALPVMGVLLMLELALGLASRFAPQANVFLLGLPAKLLTAITVVGSAWVLFPDVMVDVEATVGQTMESVLRGLGGTPTA